MPKFNDIDLKNWKELDVWVDSLWLISARDKSGKHKNIYHGNFIPQIPNQLIRRFTKENDLVLDVFLGSGTSLYECESLNRKFKSQNSKHLKGPAEDTRNQKGTILNFDI